MLRGYEPTAVDAFIQRTEATLAGLENAFPVTIAEVQAVRFPYVLRGYDPQTVDRLIGVYIARLEGGERGGREPRRVPVSSALWELSDRVERSQFPTTRFREGYDEQDVDTFLDRVVRTLRGTDPQPLNAAQVRATRFSTTRLRPGYDTAAVDALLEEVAAALERHERGGAA
ncbi:DivIVA domain-containing protein [Allonocardiopsis opalescens]|uniref:DivIVA domain-containing protein n=1 Tax=Allonocardiopsis opalescens TaxID=1144618 RepID=A0A2T0PVH3_9ACTN|nr:DivIVA domain-containing protein [Allonocardiopsis opalescens]